MKAYSTEMAQISPDECITEKLGNLAKGGDVVESSSSKLREKSLDVL
jgi:hypothetical protein